MPSALCDRKQVSVHVRGREGGEEVEDGINGYGETFGVRAKFIKVYTSIYAVFKIFQLHLNISVF
jgi:hypothetical protein